MKLMIDDKVQITAGKDKGKQGKITKVFPKKNTVIVEGANKYRRNMKKQSDKNPVGIVEIERPLPISNVALICPSCKKTTRVGFEASADGTKNRVCKKCQAHIETPKKG